MLNKPVCSDVSLHLLTTDKIEVLAVPLIWTGVTRGVYIKATQQEHDMWLLGNMEFSIMCC